MCLSDTMELSPQLSLGSSRGRAALTGRRRAEQCSQNRRETESAILMEAPAASTLMCLAISCITLHWSVTCALSVTCKSVQSFPHPSLPPPYESKSLFRQDRGFLVSISARRHSHHEALSGAASTYRPPLRSASNRQHPALFLSSASPTTLPT